jgi:RNA recognition motif-containing protein
MNNKLYVGNLPYSTDENALREIFGAKGTVQSVKIVTDPHDGRSKGFGFIEMETEEEADAAIQDLNGHEMGGRTLRVDKARPRESRPGGGGGGGGGGGRGGGGGGGGYR